MYTGRAHRFDSLEQLALLGLDTDSTETRLQYALIVLSNDALERTLGTNPLQIRACTHEREDTPAPSVVPTR